MDDLKRFASVVISAPGRSGHDSGDGRKSRAFLPMAAIAATLLVALLGALLYHFRFVGVTTTGIGEQRILSLEDGTKVYLNTATRIAVKYEASQRRVYVHSGEAFFEVTKNPERPFVVVVGDREVTALGTAFLVRREGDRTAVTLMEGRISIAPTPKAALHASAEVLEPGERLTFAQRRPTPKLDRPELRKLVAWQQGKVVIDNMRLADAVAEMNRYSARKLTIEHPETGGLLVSGVFNAGQSASFARAVAQSYGLKIIEANDSILLVGSAQSTH